MTSSKKFPDIARSNPSKFLSKLAQVGMSEIEIPLQIKTSHGSYVTPARADAYVSLDVAEAKGIHMSRLFLAVQRVMGENSFSIQTGHKVVDEFLLSHTDLSQSAYLNLRFELPLLRKALLSDNRGPRFYPLTCQFSKSGGKRRAQFRLEILYSSTCPCSAALARQLIQNKFATDFAQESVAKSDVLAWLGSEQGMIATPHGQRSKGIIEFILQDPETEIDFEALISALESALKTPVQTVVKREDEQEFARLNGSHLMFAEDAARTMTAVMRQQKNIAGFRVEARHIESLHAHDAVAVADENFSTYK